MPEGFLGRWSRRKQEVRATEQPAEAPPATLDLAAPSAPLPKVASDAHAHAQPATLPVPTVSPAAGEPPDPTDAPPPLTLADVEALGFESDYKPFVAREVAPEVRNAAFRRMFADPHFNVMDGLDTYIDDYSKPVPVPDGILRQMASAKFLKLFDEVPSEMPPETPETVGPQDVAKSEDPGERPSPPVATAQPASQETDDHHADLRLQPDDAARAEDARRGAG